VYTSPIEYRVIDQRTIEVRVGSAPRGWVRISDVTETNSQVRVSVLTVDWLPGLSTAIAKFFYFTVRLQQPLGDREVVDAQGMPADLRQCWFPCSPAP
jgi:hypothetical protein